MRAPDRGGAATPPPGRVHRRALVDPRLGYALALGLPVLVAVVVWWVDDPGYRLGTAFLASVAIVTALAGTGPALTATGVGFIGFWLTVTPPQGSFTLRWPAGPVSLLTYLVCCAAVVAVGRNRSELLAAEQRALDDAEAATRRLQVVAAASARLSAELDPDEVVRRLAEVVVPELADMGSVWMPDGDQLRRVVTLHATRARLAEVLTDRYPVTAQRDSPIAESFRRGRTVPVPDMSIRGSRSADDDAEYQRVVEALGLTQGVVVPIKDGAEVVGVLTISGTVERGPLDPGAVLAAEQIAERAAAALQKARRFAEEREIATLMQQALLPDGPRTVEGHQVGTCYVPAAAGREVGGDWWDVLRLPDGRVALVVGDVSGHGVHVAPSMAKLRHSIDGVLTHGASPAEAVTAASRLLETNRPGSYASAFVSIFDPTSRELVYSRAGHPPPLLVLADEVVSLDHPGGTLLGLNMAERSDTTITLPEQFELVAFTDGLVEEPGLAYDDGVDRLVRAVRALPHELGGQERAERLVADVVGTAGRDDVCVVMVRPERG